MKSQIISAAWWKAAGVRALRTALLVAATYVPASYTDAVPWVVLASAAVVAGALSIVTSLTGLAEVDGRTVPWYFALLSRVVKTVGQSLLAGPLAMVIFIQDIEWSAVLATTIAAGFGSLLLGVIRTLPESDEPTAPVTIATTVVGVGGEETQQAVPAVAPVEVVGAEPRH